jgi:hypothetical protein
VTYLADHGRRHFQCPRQSSIIFQMQLLYQRIEQIIGIVGYLIRKPVAVLVMKLSRHLIEDSLRLILIGYARVGFLG